jgi:APA family basic amino acid/polyamine antiporter
MGRDGLLWSGMGRVNPRGTPVRATAATAAVAGLLIATGTFQTLVAVAAFFLAVNYCLSCLALVVLRRREPELERPFRAWGYPWSAGIVLLGATVFLAAVVVEDTRTALVSAGLIAAGLVARTWLSRSTAAG